MISDPSQSYPSMQRVFAMSERDGTLSPNRFPVVEAPIADDVFAAALLERQAQTDVDAMLRSLGGAAVLPVGEVSSATNGFGSRGKTHRNGGYNHWAPTAEAQDSVSERMKFIEALGSDVQAEIDNEERDFYTYEEVIDSWDGERYMRRKYIYDTLLIDSIRKLESEALPYVLQALRAEALGALPRMRNFPGATRLKRNGEEPYMNIATLLGRLDNNSAANEHNQRPQPWQDLIRSMAEDLKRRYELRHAPKTTPKHRFYESPDWLYYRESPYDRWR